MSKISNLPEWTAQALVARLLTLIENEEKEAENILKSAGAHYVIHSLDDLYPIIRTINNNYKSP